jgi:hypothetical protein
MYGWLKKNRENIVSLATLGAMLISAYAVYVNVQQSRVDIWQKLTNEFDHDLKAERIACGKAYLNHHLDEKYQPVMDFFETIGELVRENHINRELAYNTFSYYFSGYYDATEQWLKEDNARDPTIYSDVLYLHKLWGAEPLLKTPEDLDNFFKDEANI